MSVNIFENVRAKIENGEIELALDELKEFTNDCSPEIRRELSVHTGRYNRFSRDDRQGAITYDVHGSNLATLSRSILKFVDELEKKFSERLPVDLTTDISIKLPDDTTLEKIIGIDNLKQISWLRRGLEVSSSICRILTPNGLGTGFMIGSGLLVTNHHVIQNSEEARQSMAEFNYELDPSGNELPSYRYQINADIFHTSDTNHLDYTIVGVFPNPENPPLEQWGVLKLNTEALSHPNEHVTIIQHPQGGFKKIALTANQVINQEKRYLYYTTDTMEGSSGSPVFNDAWEVIAIHHAHHRGLKKDSKGNQRHANKGILIDSIRDDITKTAPNLDSLINKAEVETSKSDNSPTQTPVEFEWVKIPGGKFFKGEDERSVYVPEYFIAKVPVTNAQYKQFIDETGYTAPEHWEKRGLFRISFHIPENKKDHPVVNVTWDDAQAFCKWAGVCLPTETQWEKAARGIDKRRYPWGNQPPNMLICNFNNLKEGTTSVDEHLDGSSPYGCLDMLGNVWEWTDSANDNGSYLMCGGAFNSNADNLYCTIRNQDTPDKLFNNVGFRVSYPGFVS